jgi:molybdenum cofactor cytidylyltransferase
MREYLLERPVQVVTNPGWASGMGSSIRLGLTALLTEASPPAVVIMLCDQPAVSAGVLDELVDRYQRDCPPIVASSYDDICGVPALFDATLFGELFEIDDCCGAREVIQRHESSVAPIVFPQGSIDVDNPDDYQRLK